MVRVGNGETLTIKGPNRKNKTFVNTTCKKDEPALKRLLVIRANCYERLKAKRDAEKKKQQAERDAEKKDKNSFFK